MTQEIREEMIALLILWTGWSASTFENKTDKELVRLYERHVSN